MPLLPPNYAQKAQIQSRISGVTTPDIKTITGQVGSVFATQLNPTRIVKVAQQGDSNRTILTKGTGSCGAVSTHNTPMAIPYLTSQMLDSYGLPVEWGPQADDRIRLEYSTPGNPLALHRVKPNVSKLPLTGLDVGKGLVKIDYGKRDITTPDGVVHPAPGVTDPVVQKPKLQVELATVSNNPASGLMFGGDDTNGVMLDLATVAGVNVSGLLMNGGDDLNGLIANVDGTSIVIDPTTHKLTATGTGGTGGPTSNLIARRGVHIDFTATPTETVTLALHAGTELTDATPYLYALTYQTLAKETPHGPTATITTTTGNQEVSGTVGAVDTTANPDVVSRGLYRSHDGGVTFHLVTTLNLTAQTYLDTLTDAVVDTNQQPPTTNDTVIETWLKPLTSGLLNTTGTDGNRLAIATTNTGTALAIPSGTGLLTVQYDPAWFTIDGSNRLTSSLTAGNGITISGSTISAWPDGTTIDFNTSGQLEVKPTSGSALCCVPGTCSSPVTTGGGFSFQHLLGDCASFAEWYGIGSDNSGTGTVFTDFGGDPSTGFTQAEIAADYAAAEAAGAYVANFSFYEIVYGVQYFNASSKTWGPVQPIVSTYSQGWAPGDTVVGCPDSTYVLGVDIFAASGATPLANRRLVRASWDMSTDSLHFQDWAAITGGAIPNSYWYIHPQPAPVSSHVIFYDTLDPTAHAGAGIGTPDTAQDWCASSLPLDGTTLTYNTAGKVTAATSTGITLTATSPTSSPLTVNTSTGSAALTTSGTGTTTITPTATTGSALSVYSPSTTSGSLLTLGTSSGGTTTPLVTVTPTTMTIGTATASNDVTINGDLSVLPTNPLSVSVIVNAPASQSALLTEWKVNGVHKASVSASGVVDAIGYTINGVPLSAGGAGELLMTNGVTNPPVPITNEAGDDWLWVG